MLAPEQGMDEGAPAGRSQGAGGSPLPTPASAELLPREVAVLQLAAQGLAPHTIAVMLHLPRHAVEELLRRCAWRLEAADLKAAIGLARRRKLIE